MCFEWQIFNLIWKPFLLKGSNLNFVMKFYDITETMQTEID